MATAATAQDQATRPVASTSTSAPPTATAAAPSRSSSKLNPQSATFSFFQADEVATSSSHSYPYRPAEDRPMPPPSMGMAPRGFLSNAMRNSGGGGSGMMINYGQPYPMEMMQQGYGQQQHHEHWGGPKSNGGWQQPPLPLNGNGMQGGGGGGPGPRYYSPPPSLPSPHPLPTSHSGGVFFPVSNGPPLQPNLLPAFQPTRPTPFPPPSLSTAPPPSAPHTPPRSRRPRPPPPSEAPALSFGPNTRPPPGFVLPSSATSSSPSTLSRSNSTPAPQPQVVPKTAAASPLKPPSLPPAPPPSVVPAPSPSPVVAEVVASFPSPIAAPTPAASSPIAAPTPVVPPSSPISTPAPSTPSTAGPTPPFTTALSTAPPSSHSSPLLTPQSPTTTATTLSSDLELPSLPLPSTPKSPAVPRKSWADLLRSPPSSAPPPLHPNGTPLSPITQHIPRAPPTKKTLAETLEGVESAYDGHEVIPRGLINNGNMCFANAILQVLVYCSPFWSLVERVGRETKGDLGGQTPSMDAMILFLEEFRSPNTISVVRHRSKSSSLSLSSLPPPDAFIPPPTASDWSDPFVPEQVYESIKPNKRFDAMRRGHQEDAEEFLGFFLDTLHDEILVMIDRVDKGKMPEEEGKSNGAGATEEWLEVGSKGRTATTRTTETRESPITKIFGGQLRSVLRCSGQKDSITLEPYQRLQLDIQPDHVRTIEDALANLTLPEPLPDFVSRAGVRVEATKQVYLETFPPVLILHLKRFLYDNVGGVQKSGKSIGYGTELEIREDIIAPTKRTGKPVRYQLFGVVYHHGKSAQGGHYTVAVRQQLNSTSWIHIDDTAIRPILPGDVAVKEGGRNAGAGADGEKGAYLLLYTRL